MAMRESDFQTKWMAWLRNNYFGNAAFELKITHTDRLPFTALREHQRDALLAVASQNFSYKIADDSRGFKPFDCFALGGNAKAFVVVQFYKPRVRECFAIRIEDWIAESEKSKPRSLTRERAAELGTRIVLGERSKLK